MKEDNKKIYQTTFYLEKPIPEEDYKNWFKESPDQAPYHRVLLESNHIDLDDVDHITWNLYGDQQGYVDIVTNREFTEDELSVLSDLIKEVNKQHINTVFDERITDFGDFDQNVDCSLQDVTNLDVEAPENGWGLIPRWGILDPDKYKQMYKQKVETDAKATAVFLAEWAAEDDGMSLNDAKTDINQLKADNPDQLKRESDTLNQNATTALLMNLDDALRELYNQEDNLDEENNMGL